MDITTLAAWGEFIGGIAVVVSLIYLASQIRQNSRLQRSSTTALIANNGIASTTLLTGDPELSRIFREGMGDARSLSEPDRFRFNLMVGATIGAFAMEYFLWREDAVSPRVWSNRRRNMFGLFVSGGFQQWWSEWRWNWDEEFGEYVDGLIREGEAAEPTSPVS
jgi:hypothetical protein